jgi:hypothetical protein
MTPGFSIDRADRLGGLGTCNWIATAFLLGVVITTAAYKVIRRPVSPEMTGRNGR